MENEKNKEEIQKPEKPQKKQGKTLSFSLMNLIIIAAAVLIVLVGGTLFGVNMMLKGIKPQTVQTDSEKDEKESKEDAEKTDSKENIEDTKEDLLRKAIISDESDYDYFELSEEDRIITNPLGSPRFVVLRLGFFTFDGKDTEDKEEKINILENTRLIARMKNTINNEIGNMTEAQIQELRPTLPEFIKEKLTPLFLKEKVYLHEVLIIQFVIQ